MENRIEKRINKDISVLFYKDGLPVSVGKTKNIAPSGVFIENGYQPDIRIQCVRLAFMVPNHVRTKLCHVNAYVVHYSEAGIGLMIDHFDQEAILPNVAE